MPGNREHGIALDGDAFTHRRRSRPRAFLPIGADVILRQFLDVALEAGPNSQHWRELREHAGIVVDMALAGEWNNALRSSHLVVPGHASGPPRGSWSA